MAGRLTRRALDAWLKSPTMSPWLWCGEIRGFGVHRRNGGRAAFVVQYRVGRGRLAKRRRAVLGEYPTINPEQARERASEHISAGWRGDDLVAEKQALQTKQGGQSETYAALVPTFYTARRVHLKGRSADQYESIWDRLILPEFGSKIVRHTKRREIAGLMDTVETSAGTSVADRVHEQMALFFAGMPSAMTTLHRR